MLTIVILPFEKVLQTEQAIKAGDTANKALHLSQQNEKDIAELKADKKSNISLGISGLSLVVLILFSILNYLK